VLLSANVFVERNLCKMNMIVQAPPYLDQTLSVEQLINEIGPEIDQEVDEIDELLQTLQEQLASFRFAADPINLKQRAAIQQALDDCAHARAIQARLATFITNLQTCSLNGEAPHPSEQANRQKEERARE
jgi:hypothetical protein